MVSYITFGIALILVVGAANGLECFSCETEDSVACAEALGSFSYNIEECRTVGKANPLIGPKCYKLEAKDIYGGVLIARGCHNPPIFECNVIAKTIDWLAALSGETLKISCHTCDTDRCNSASKLAGFIVFGLLLAILVFLF